MTDRRTFLGAISFWVLASSLVAGAQQASRVYRVGWLGNSKLDAPDAIAAWDTFRLELERKGWTEGRNIVFEHRFAASELEGHALGNIVIAGLTETLGDFGLAIDEALRLLGGVGRVIPATAEPVSLKATYRRVAGPDGEISVEGVVEGEKKVGETTGVPAIRCSITKRTGRRTEPAKISQSLNAT